MEPFEGKRGVKIDKAVVAVLIGLAILGISALIGNDPEEEAPTEDTVITNSAVQTTKPIEEEAPVINTYEIKWSDKFNGYETKISKIETEGKELRVYFQLFNGSDATFNNGVEWGHAVINQKQIDANPFGSEEVGGEHLSDTKHEGFVVYYADSEEELKALKEVRLTWSLTNNDTYDSKDYDLKLPLE